MASSVMQGGVFRILVGAHVGVGPDGCDCLLCSSGRAKNHIYRARQESDSEDYVGDIIYSPNLDLCARFNSGQMPKYERVRQPA